ncbi:hypothetical protein [Bacteroides sp. 224]|uniref:hypothetical protein n=1 Tax=Bacteroides sp. 224 TaxID=2302936 RepID=UPI0013CF6935|nr:hypothetical protein [Bacteroides sp. 224]NDV67087.1 hypothetical protein [Bacteroides sp. 224]
MKHLQKLPFGFLIAMVLLLSCQEDSFLSEWNKTTENPLVTEARQFFEETIYEAALQGAIVQDIGWSPGEVTPR